MMAALGGSPNHRLREGYSYGLKREGVGEGEGERERRSWEGGFDSPKKFNVQSFNETTPLSNLGSSGSEGMTFGREELPAKRRRIRRHLDIPDDGCVWLKYGQKHIKGTIFIRNYYRCAQFKDLACPAKRTIDFDPKNPQDLRILYPENHNHKIIQSEVPKEHFGEVSVSVCCNRTEDRTEDPTAAFAAMSSPSLASHSSHSTSSTSPRSQQEYRMEHDMETMLLNYEEGGREGEGEEREMVDQSGVLRMLGSVGKEELEGFDIEWLTTNGCGGISPCVGEDLPTSSGRERENHGSILGLDAFSMEPCMTEFTFQGGEIDENLLTHMQQHPTVEIKDTSALLHLDGKPAEIDGAWSTEDEEGAKGDLSPDELEYLRGNFLSILNQTAELGAPLMALQQLAAMSSSYRQKSPFAPATFQALKMVTLSAKCGHVSPQKQPAVGGEFPRSQSFWASKTSTPEPCSRGFGGGLGRTWHAGIGRDPTALLGGRDGLRVADFMGMHDGIWEQI